MLVCVLALILLSPSTASVSVVLFALGAPTLALSGPWCYKKLPRTVQDVLRFTMGAVIALCGYLLLCREWMVAAPVAMVLFIFWKAYLEVRRRRRLRACDGCEELSDKGICSGCMLQAKGVRRYEKIATQLYLASGKVPALPLSTQDAGRASVIVQKRL